MRVLFVSSAAPGGGPKAVVGNQATSLSQAGVQLSHFLITKRGLAGYLRSIPALARTIRREKPGVVHAHYLWSGITARLAGASPLVVSLMGSEARSGVMARWLTRLFARRLWQRTIVKSASMAGELSLAGAILMPNGVDTDAFRPLDRSLSLSMTGFDGSLFNIIFVGDPSRHEKNYSLAGEAVQILSDRAVNLITLKDIPAGMMPWYYNAANLLLLTSLWEGSPNCVKEAMACNLPVVATAVGDVPQLISGLEGCFISTFDSHHVAECIEKAMTFSDRTRGRERIMERGLDAPSTAARLVRLYEVISGEVHGG